MPGPVQAPETETTRQEQHVPLFNVVLLDDDDHTYDYVIEMLRKLFCMSEGDRPTITPSRWIRPAAPWS